MKKSVTTSTLSFIITLLIMAFLVGLLFLCKEPSGFYFLSAITVGLLLAALFYSPSSLNVDDENLYVNRSLKIKKIPLKDIEYIQIVKPSEGGKLLIGSKGFMGYWGWFRDLELGLYFAYYGKPSERFLIKLKNGNQYMFGCKQKEEMIRYIDSKI